MTFEEKVKKARINAGMSQAQLAEKVGVSVRAITAYERDGSKPRPAKLAKLAEALKVSTNYLTDDNCDNPLEGIVRDPYVYLFRSNRLQRPSPALCNEALKHWLSGAHP